MQRIAALLLPSRKNLVIANFNEIVWCKADKGYVWIFLSDGRKLVVSGIIKKVQEILPSPPFFRCHHSYLVNLDHASYIGQESGNVFVTLGEINIPVSREKREGLLALYHQL